jgi:hypothetical protein
MLKAGDDRSRRSSRLAFEIAHPIPGITTERLAGFMTSELCREALPACIDCFGRDAEVGGENGLALSRKD